MNMQYILSFGIRWILLFTAFSPLVVFSKSLFPYVFSKSLFFRSLIEFALILFFSHVLISIYCGKLEINLEKVFRILKQPFFILLILFFISSTLSTILAENPYRAFWGDVERSEGLWTLLHFLIFLLLILSFFKEEDWQRFLKISIFSGFLVSILAILQYFNIVVLFFSKWIKIEDFRPGSLFENPAFMSAYLLFVLGFSAVMVLNQKRFSYNNFWVYFPVITFIVSFIAIFLSRTRGAILGLGVGLIFILLCVSFDKNLHEYKLSKKYNFLSLRNVFALLTVMSLIFPAVFWTTRSSLFWKNIPGFDRLTELNLSDDSLQTRLISLGSSFEAFKERPILGWGLENYRVAYNKYYNPSYARYAETWFDRAHNKLVEMAVMQGMIGLLIYVGLWLSLFHLLFYEFKQGSKYVRFVLGGMFVAYFIENLFLFDTAMTYLMFFFSLGFLLSNNLYEERKLFLNKISYPAGGASFLGIFFILYVFYFYNYIPYSQMASYRKAIGTSVAEKMLASWEDFISPYNYAQATIRFFLVEDLYHRDIFSQRKFDVLGNKAIASLNEVVEKDSNYEPRHYVILAESLNEMAKDDINFFKASGAYLGKALELSPNRQDIYYLLAFVASGEERNGEAIQIARKAVDLDPGVAKAHFNLGLNLALAGRERWLEAEKELLKSQELGFVWAPLFDKDTGNMEIIYKKMIEAYVLERDAKSVIRVSEQFKGIADEVLRDELNYLIDLAQKGKWKEIETIFKIEKEEEPTQEEFISLLYKYVKERDVSGLVAVAERFKSVLKDPTGKDELDLLINLAKNGNWNIIENTFIEK